MAIKKYYLPRAIPERVIWVKNFAAKLPTHATTFGISTTELAFVLLFATFYEFLVGYIDQARAFTSDLTAFLQKASKATTGVLLGTQPPFTPNPASAPGGLPTEAGGFSIIAGLVRRIKGNTANYNDNIGRELRIIGAEDDFDQDTYVPPIKAQMLPGEVKLTTDQPEPIESFNWEVRVNDGQWVYAGHTTHPVFTDHRPLQEPGRVEKREYRVRAEIHDHGIGQLSLPVTVNYGG